MYPLRWSLFLFWALCLAAPLRAQAPDGAAPVLRGQLVAGDGGAVRGVRVLVRAAAFADSAEVDSLGRFALPLPPAPGDDPLELVVDAPGGADRAYHPALVRLPREALGEEARIVLVPRRWTIPAGRFAGVSVEIRLQRAFRAACSRCSGFYRAASTQEADAGYGRVRSWPEEVFPLRVAFDRDGSGEAITARDSAGFWRAVESLEADYGADLFRPVPFHRTLAMDEPVVDVVLVQIEPPLTYQGLGLTLGQGAELVAGAVWVKRASLLSGPDAEELLHHELMHTLGFGHTCAWRSVVADSNRCREMRSPSLTADDVAYAQLLQRVNGLQRAHQARWGIDAALAGEGAHERGEPLTARAR